MKRILSLLLCALLILPLCACGEKPEQGERLSWQTAFRESTLPDGEVPADCVAFYKVDEKGGISVTNVPLQEVTEYAAGLTAIPRTRYFEKFLPENLLPLLPILDYAVAHSYCRMSVPTTDFGGDDINAHARYLRYMYRINGSGVGGLSVRSFELEDGRTRNYVLVTLAGMEVRGMMPKYLEAIEAAQRIVSEAPQGLSERDRALYFYHYLTENVRYDEDSYYEKGGWNLLYDTLVKHKTVCAGYTEALYYLYNLSGIECFTIEGYIADGLGTGGYHIWNVAKIDGKYYQFDSTWDEGVPPSQYRYFGVSAADMQSYYERDVETVASEYCPDCTDSLLPCICPDVSSSDKARVVNTLMYLCDWWYADPSKTLTCMTEDSEMERITETEDGIALAMPYELFTDQLGYVMTPNAAKQFCDGRFCEDQKLTRALFPQKTDYRGHRLTAFTEEEDGTATATVALLNDDLQTVDTITVTLTFVEQNGYYFIDSIEGLK